MRKTILILLLSLSTSHLFSQSDSLLRRFKYRIDHYRQVVFGIGGGTQVYNRDFVAGTYKNNGTSGYLEAGYQSIKSTDRVLLTISGGVGSGYNWSKSENPSSNNKSKSFAGSYDLNILNQWFFGNTFIELGAGSSGYYSSDKGISINPSGSLKTITDDYTAAIHIGMGKGRLENITDMQNALWLYKALQTENRLSRSLSDEELNELGRTITRANNTRVLDVRKRTQFILETTDQFFRQKRILTHDDIRYFGTLNDILFFAVNNTRLSGTEIFIRLTPTITGSAQKSLNSPPSIDFKNNFSNKSVLLSAGIGRYIPANLRHQNNYGIALNLQYVSNDMSLKFFPSQAGGDVDFNQVIRQAGIHLFFQHAIYPNTRTVVSFNLNSDGGYEQVENRSDYFGMADISATVNYFISYRTKLVGNFGSRYQKNIFAYNYSHVLELQPDNFQLFANAGLQVSL